MRWQHLSPSYYMAGYARCGRVAAKRCGAKEAFALKRGAVRNAKLRPTVTKRTIETLEPR